MQNLDRRAGETAVDLLGVGLPLLAVFHLLFGGWFPNRAGLLGHDYSYFLPHLLAGDFWIIRNGFFSIPWFTPAFCGGVPVFANPQSPFATLPQVLSATLVDPLTAVYVTLLVFAWLGYAGMLLLAGRLFGVSRPAAIAAATLFLFNGLFVHRIAAGHLAFHPFMLTPLVAFLLLRESRAEAPNDIRWSHARDVVVAAMCIAYMVVAGMVQAMVPVLLSIVVLGLWHGAARAGGSLFWKKLAAAAAVAVFLTAARMAAVLSFLGRFPRNEYPLPGADSVAGIVRLAAESLFVRPAHEAAKTIIVHSAWPLEQHEWEYGVTFIPLLALIAWAVAAVLRNRGQVRIISKPVPVPGFLAIVVILALPLALNVYSPSWNALLKQMPLLGSSVTLVRWFGLYIPLLALATALAIDAVVRPARWRQVVAAASVAACVLVNALADDAYYQKQSYDPRPVTSAYRSLAQGIPDITAIGDVRVPGNDGLVRGESLPRCYEPIFGYRQENLPIAPLVRGPVFHEVVRESSGNAGRLNLKNPACYVFPGENRCAPGDHFTTAERDAAAAFAQYRPFPFEMPARQKTAGAVSALALLACAAFLAAFGIRRLRQLVD